MGGGETLDNWCALPYSATTVLDISCTTGVEHGTSAQLAQKRRQGYSTSRALQAGPDIKSKTRLYYETTWHAAPKTGQERELVACGRSQTQLHPRPASPSVIPRRVLRATENTNVRRHWKVASKPGAIGRPKKNGGTPQL